MRFVATALLVSFVSFGVLAAAESARKSHLDYRREAAAAYQRKDYSAARAAFSAALALRPDSPRYLHNLAAVSALNGDEKAALDYLHQLAALGVATAAERDPDFATLQGKPEFLRVMKLLAENRAPQGEAELFAELPGRTGIIEGLAYRPRTGDLFFSDVHHRCIWRRDRDGRIVRFSDQADDLLGIFGIVVDEARNTLWAAMSALPEMSGYEPAMKGQGALAEFNLATSELRRVIPVPGDGRDHGLGDLIVAPDGTIYATDTKAPIIWQYTPGDEEMVTLADSPLLVSLQGLVLFGRTLIVADYANGLFTIDVKDATLHALQPPSKTTLLGIDGLVPVPGGIVAVQNGVAPERVIHVALAADFASITAVTVLARGLPYMSDLALVTLIEGRPGFIAGAGWEGFDPAKSPQPRSHAVRIFQTTLP